MSNFVSQPRGDAKFGKSAVVQNSVANSIPSVANAAIAKLDENQKVAVRKYKMELMKGDSKVLESYGDDVQKEISELADGVLAQTRSTDFEIIQGRLTDIIVKAKGITLSGAQDSSKLPLIGSFINKFRNTRERIQGQFDSASTQIVKVVTEVDVMSNKLHVNLGLQEQLYHANLRQYKDLECLTIAGKLAMEELQMETDAFEAKLLQNATPDPFDAQQLADAKAYIAGLGMKVSAFEQLGMSAFQTAPMIRMMQHTGTQLIERFKLVKSQTIPQWKRMFMVGLMVQDNQNAADLTNTIADATNEMARITATMLKQSTVDAAKASQRGVIDLATLEHANTELISTIDQVRAITDEGKKHRELVSQRIGEMKQQLKTNLIKGN